MIIYNVTFNVEDSVHEHWREWMQQHIRQVLATGLFVKAVFSKVLIEEEMCGTTYSVQYYAQSKSNIEKYQAQYAQQLQAQLLKRFEDKVMTFKTALEFIDEFTVNETL